jgi:hypothetical protein
MRFAGPCLDSFRRENTSAFEGSVLTAPQNRFSRRKVSRNRVAASSRNGCENGNKNGPAVTTSHLLLPRQRGKTAVLLPISQPNSGLSETRSRKGGRGSATRGGRTCRTEKLTRNFLHNGFPAQVRCFGKKRGAAMGLRVLSNRICYLVASTCAERLRE